MKKSLKTILIALFGVLIFSSCGKNELIVNEKDESIIDNDSFIARVQGTGILELYESEYTSKWPRLSKQLKTEEKNKVLKKLCDLKMERFRETIKLLSEIGLENNWDNFKYLYDYEHKYNARKTKNGWNIGTESQCVLIKETFCRIEEQISSYSWRGYSEFDLRTRIDEVKQGVSIFSSYNSRLFESYDRLLRAIQIGYGVYNISIPNYYDLQEMQYELNSLLYNTELNLSNNLPAEVKNSSIFIHGSGEKKRQIAKNYNYLKNLGYAYASPQDLAKMTDVNTFYIMEYLLSVGLLPAHWSIAFLHSTASLLQKQNMRDAVIKAIDNSDGIGVMVRYDFELRNENPNITYYYSEICFNNIQTGNCVSSMVFVN